MTKTITLAMVLVLAACGEDPPSCQNAVANFYAAGCAFYDAQGNLGTQLEATSLCSQINGTVSDDCRGEFEGWLFCIDGVDSPASDQQCRSCSEESDAVVACEA